MIRKVLALALSLFCIFFVSTSPVSALEAGDIVVQVNPAEQELDLIPGEIAFASFKVKNIGRQPFDINLKTKPYQVLNDSYDPDFVSENSYTKIYNWIEFSQTEYHLEPEEEITVDFSINVPEDVPEGGQYAAIIVETRDSADENASFRTINQVASLIYGHVAGETNEAGLLMAHSIPLLLLSSPFSITTNIKNDGNIDFRAIHSITVWDYFTGREVLNANSIDENGRMFAKTSPIVLPASSRFNSITWEGAPQLGAFKVRQEISFLDQNYTFDSVVVLCPIWLAAAVLFIILLAIFWIILRVRRHSREHPRY